MEFLGRKKELEALQNMYDRDGFQMAIVYGRRRIGKTSLLTEFIKDKNSLFLSAEEVNDSYNLKIFSKQLGEKIGLASLPAFSDWHEFFNLIAEKFSKERLVLVIDEYPYAAMANKSLNSTLQHSIDHVLKNTNIFLILCGSSMSFMEEKVLGAKSPLFGRRTGQLKLLPLDYYDASKFYPNLSDEEKILYYATVGGTPFYLSMINEKMTFEENMKNLYFSINAYLMNEGTMLMRQEFREPANYNVILQAIASGAVTVGEIANYTKLESKVVSRYLGVLQDLQYVEKVLPFDSNPLKSRNSQYRITENFIAFWYRYVFPNRKNIELGEGDIIFKFVEKDLSVYVGHVFEEITRQYLRRVNLKEELPFLAKNFGTWWGKDASGQVQELDVVCESFQDKELLIGECKWENSIKVNKVLTTLLNRATLFPQYETYPYLFTKNPIKVHEGYPITAISIENYFQEDL